MTFADFQAGFLTDSHPIAIPLTTYAIRYAIGLNPKDGDMAPSLESLREFVLNKLVESEEPLVFYKVDGQRFIYGTIFSHRVFFEWLLTQKMK